MAEEEHRDWLDEAFDDKKAQEELEKAQQSNRLGCLLAAVALVVVFFVVIIFSFVGLLGTFQSL